MRSQPRNVQNTEQGESIQGSKRACVRGNQSVCKTPPITTGCQGDVTDGAININYMSLLKNACFNKNGKALEKPRHTHTQHSQWSDSVCNRHNWAFNKEMSDGLNPSSDV